jgi:hypothetical protein
MKEANEILTGSIVYYQGGYYRVRARFSKTVNLGPVFGNRLLHKGVHIADVREAGAEWYSLWSQSETYQCM